jgi:hypothetical protein
MPLFRKKPIEVEAVQFFQDEYDAIGTLPPGTCDCLRAYTVEKVHVHTMEGIYPLKHGDWIVKGIKGEYYPVNADIFAQTYEPVKEP